MENTWILGFKPKVVVFVCPCPEDETAMMVQAICADRVFKVRHNMAIKAAGNDEIALRFLG